MLALIVDGYSDARTMYGESFGWCRYRVDEAGDGVDAIAKAISWRPDVIVTATHLAKMDGYELC